MNDKPSRTRKILKCLAIVGLTILNGCSDLYVLNPKGAIGVAEKELIKKASLAMLVIVVPVILLTLIFAWRYRASKQSSIDEQNWLHSIAIEIMIWIIPSIIVAYLSVLAWRTSHELDPYKRIVSPIQPIDIEVIALDWKWLFIYPKFGIASVNEIAIPVGTPINFYITSDSVMNSFFISGLGGQIYAMAGMQTQLHLIADKVGNYIGISANYSGQGFSDMKFQTLAKSNEQFNEWVKKVKASSDHLDMHTYHSVSKPSEKASIRYFSAVDSQLFDKIITKYTSYSHAMNNHAFNEKNELVRTCKIKG